MTAEPDQAATAVGATSAAIEARLLPFRPAACSFELYEHGVLVCDPRFHVEGMARKIAQEVV